MIVINSLIVIDIFVSLTPPIDPLQLLTALSPLLSTDGGIKSAEEVVKLARCLMKKFSKKLVSRCVYIQILKATEQDILLKFLNEGGWEIVNNWLKEGKEKEDNGFLFELLEMYKKLPMTVNKLKENNSARIIKALCKIENETDIKKVAQDIVNAWLTLVKRETSDNGSDKTKKKKKHHNVKPKDASKVKKVKTLPTYEIEQDEAQKAPSNQVVPTKKGTVKIRKVAAGKKPDKLAQSLKRTNTDDLEDAKPMVIAIEKPLKKPKQGDRPSTVKTYRTSFRATGLEEAPSIDKPIPKKGKVKERQVPPLTIKRPFNSTTEISTPPEKKLKPVVVVADKLIINPVNLITPVEVNKEQNHYLPPKSSILPKSKSVHVLQDSTGFMDALVSTPAPPIRKKKKVVNQKTTSDATSPTAQSPSISSPPAAVPDSKPLFQFYKDTLESPKETTPPLENGVKFTGDGERTPSPPPENETQEDKEHKTEEITSDAPQPVSEQNGNQQDFEEISNLSCLPILDCNHDFFNFIEQPISNLKVAGSKKKKSVTWADDSSFQVHYFILDEAERVNVNTMKNFGDMKSMELQMEKQHLMNVRKLKGDLMEEQICWRNPSSISNISTFIRGELSTEKETQRLRQQGVLQYLFLSKDSAIDAPQEPDPDQNVIHTNTKIIPLEDETNQAAVNDYSHSNMFPNNDFSKTELPPALSNLVLSMNKQTGFQNQMISPPQLMQQQMDIMDNGHMPMMPPQQYNQSYDDEMYDESYDMPRSPVPMQMSQNMQSMRMQNHLEQMRPQNMRPMHPRGGFNRGGGMGPNNMRPQWRGPRGPPRGMGPRGPRPRFTPYIPCRNFMNDGSCQFADKCRFLHPGINGPPL
ncbi:Serine/threonine-protein phosphatase 1 regulatory subunit 10 [Nymphon striatum]|nr:Serine/threonine-protein phosphatase 1 regulatory subunit 10 [Nymphon striatum]